MSTKILGGRMKCLRSSKASEAAVNKHVSEIPCSSGYLSFNQLDWGLLLDSLQSRRTIAS